MYIYYRGDWVIVRFSQLLRSAVNDFVHYAMLIEWDYYPWLVNMCDPSTLRLSGQHSWSLYARMKLLKATVHSILIV